MFKFIRRGKKIIPIRIKGKIDVPEKILKSAKKAKNKRLSDKYMAEGYKDIINKDLRPNGASIHEKANILQKLEFAMVSKKSLRKETFSQAKEFIRRNRS